MAQYGYFRESVLNDVGVPVSGVTVSVRKYGETGLATIYGRSSGGIYEVTQPLITDSSGEFSFYADPGQYTITINKSGWTTTRDVVCAEIDPDANAIASVWTSDESQLRKPSGSLFTPASTADVSSVRTGAPVNVALASAVNVVSSSLSTGMIVRCVDWSTSGDGLGCDAQIVAAGTATADGYYYINDASGTRQLKRIVDLAKQRVVDAVGATSSVNMTNGQILAAKGVASSGDGLNGQFIYSSSSTATADGVDIVTPSSGSGRFIRSVDGRSAASSMTSVYSDDPRFASYRLLGGDTLAMQTAMNLAASWGVGVDVAERSHSITSLTWPSGLKWLRGKSWRTTTFLRPASDTAARIMLNIVSKNNFEVSGITFDGNLDNNSSYYGYGVVVQACYSYAFIRCRFRKMSRVSNAAGMGLLLKQTPTTSSLGQEQLVENCICEYNGYTGLRLEDSGNSITVRGGRFNYNGSGGIGFNRPSAISPSTGSFRVVDVECYYNATAGISVTGSFVLGIDGSTQIYGHGSDSITDVEISGCKCHYNGSYGVYAGITRVQITGGSYCYNGTDTSGDYAGIGLNAYYASVRGAIVSGNDNWNIDAGALMYGVISGCHIINSTGTGLNLGAAIEVLVEGNIFRDSGVSGAGFDISLHSGDGSSSYGFNQQSERITIRGNKFSKSTDAGWGIYGDGYVGNLVVENNEFGDGYYDGVRCLSVFSENGRVADNILTGSGKYYKITATSTVYVPDICDAIEIDSYSASISSIDFVYSKLDKVGKVIKTSSGSGYTSTPTVSWSGGGGSGLSLAAVRAQDGTISHVNFTSNGSGFTSSPTITVSGGGGSGAAFEATFGNWVHDGRELAVRFSVSGSLTAGTKIKLNGVASGSTLSMSAGSEIVFVYRQGVLYEKYRIAT